MARGLAGFAAVIVAFVLLGFIATYAFAGCGNSPPQQSGAGIARR
jgi:hypothetical protein